MAPWTSVCVHTYDAAGQTESPCRPSLHQELKSAATKHRRVLMYSAETQQVPNKWQ